LSDQSTYPLTYSLYVSDTFTVPSSIYTIGSGITETECSSLIIGFSCAGTACSGVFTEDSETQYTLYSNALAYDTESIVVTYSVEFTDYSVTR